MKQNKFVIKLIGTALLLHVILIAMSIIEVAIYSYAINPGNEQEVYEKHATESGPWISAIFGSIFIFLFVRRFVKKFSVQQLTYTIWLPATYLIIDLVLLAVSGYQLKDYALEYVLSSTPKIAAAAIAYYLYRDKHSQSVGDRVAG